MKFSRSRLFPLVVALVLPLWPGACTGGGAPESGEADEAAQAQRAGEHAAAEAAEVREAGEHQEGGEARESGEHAEGGEHGAEGAHDEAGEESGVYIGGGETWDVVRNGARLVLAFNNEAGAFIGTVENTVGIALCGVRVEVHLNTGTELGPTPVVNLPPGRSTEIRLATEGEAFDSFTAHPEMSPCGGG